MHIYYVIIALILITMQNAYSSAWIVEAGRTQFIIQNYNTKQKLHSNRNIDLPIYLHTSSINSYIEHGLSQKISLGLTTSASLYKVDDKFSNNSKTSLVMDNLDLFGKINLLSTPNFVISSGLFYGQSLYRSYQLHQSSAIVKPYRSTEARIMIGLGSGNGSLLSGIIGGDGSFINAEVGYRINDKTIEYNELRSQIELGLAINDQNLKMILLQYFRWNKLYKVIPYNSNIRNGISDNKIQTFMSSILIDSGSKTLIQFGILYEISNKIIGTNEEGVHKRGMFLGFWM